LRGNGNSGNGLGEMGNADVIDTPRGAVISSRALSRAVLATRSERREGGVGNPLLCG
jgi:hypothetical protein